MGMIGSARTRQDALIIARAWEIQNDLPNGTIHIKYVEGDGWQVWE
jgi:hypothetical protein